MSKTKKIGVKGFSSGKINAALRLEFNFDPSKLTTPFFQADQTVSISGFGIGLTICKKIIEAHKGRLSIESEKGIGSAFILHLPSN